jgi:DMSO/TMAO reductase YedYZ molybdopterin-dependent catalytic subunit
MFCGTSAGDGGQRDGGGGEHGALHDLRPDAGICGAVLKLCLVSSSGRYWSGPGQQGVGFVLQVERQVSSVLASGWFRRHAFAAALR